MRLITLSKFFLSLGILFFVSSTALGQLLDQPKASLKLEMSQPSGTNGCAVVYNPTAGLYYACIAGNASFPLEVFSQSGDNVYQTEAGSDVRGMWWNPKTKQLEANGYGDYGIVGMSLDGMGYPSLGNSSILPGADHQPDPNSCGAYDGKKLIWYFDGSQLLSYSRKSGNFVGSRSINSDIPSIDDVNYTSVIYTGVKGMELGILDHAHNKVLLICKKTGAVNGTVILPNNAVCNNAFRFAYANKHVFLFDVDTRTWTGYQIFL